MPKRKPCIDDSLDRELKIETHGRTRICKSCKFTCTDAKEFLHHQTYAHSQDGDVDLRRSLSSRRKSHSSLPIIKRGLLRSNSLDDLESPDEITTPLNNNNNNNSILKVIESGKQSTNLKIKISKNLIKSYSSEEVTKENIKSADITQLSSHKHISHIDQDSKSSIDFDSNSKHSLDMDEPDSEQMYILNPEGDEGEQDEEGRLIIAEDDSQQRPLRHPTRSGNIQNRTYVCNICEFSSTSAKIYLHHQKDAHNLDITIYECDICEYATKYKQKLPRHRKLHFTGKDILLSGSDLDSSFGERSFTHLDDREMDVNVTYDDEEDLDEEEVEEEEMIPVTMAPENPEVSMIVPMEKKKRKTRQEVDPAKYFEVFDDAGVKYACSKCGNVYKWRKSLNKHWKEKHFGDIPDASKPPPGLAKLNTISHVKYRVPSSIGYEMNSRMTVSPSGGSYREGRSNTATPQSVQSYSMHEQQQLHAKHPSHSDEMASMMGSNVVMPKFIGPFITNTLFSPQNAALAKACKQAEAAVAKALKEQQGDKGEMPMDLSGSSKKSPDINRNFRYQTSPMGMQLKTEPRWNNNDIPVTNGNKDEVDGDNDSKQKPTDAINPILQCTRCGFVAKTLVDYSSHMTLHLNKRAFKCAECQEHFNCIDDLNKHFLDLHSEKISEHKEAIQKIPHGLQQTYHLLKMPLSSIGSISTNEMSSGEPKYLKCSMCQFVAKWPAELQKHAVSHSEERPFVCMVCGSTYKWKWDLVKHFEKSHSSLPNPYKRREQGGASTSPSSNEKPSTTPPPSMVSPQSSETPNMYEHVSGQIMSSTAAALLDAGTNHNIRKIPFVHSLELEPVKKKRRLSETDATTTEDEAHDKGNGYILAGALDTDDHERPSSEPLAGQLKVSTNSVYGENPLHRLQMSSSSALRDIQNLIPIDEDEKSYLNMMKEYRYTEEEKKAIMITEGLKNSSGEKTDILLPYKCNMCEYRARWPSEITQHMKNHSDEKPYHCPRCSYKSKWKWDVVKHLKRCGGGTIKDVIDTNKMRKMPPPNVTVMPQGMMQYQMSQLNKLNSSSEETLMNGFRSQSPSGYGSSDMKPGLPYNDEYNEDSGDSTDDSQQQKMFTSLVNQGVHHCLECPFIGHSPAELKRHTVLHSENKPFTCTICGYSSRWKCDLKKHMKTYNHYDPNAASKESLMAAASPMFLQDKFKLEAFVDQSMSSAADEERNMLKCGKCNFVTHKMSVLDAHVKIHGEGSREDKSMSSNSKFKCKQCDYQAEDLVSFLQHKKSHATNGTTVNQTSPESTDQTQEQQVSNRTRDKHRRKPMQQFKCTQCAYTCFKKSVLLMHEQLHKTQETEVGCLYCEYNESNKGLLLQHMRLHNEFDESECMEFLKAAADNEEYREEDEFPQDDGDSCVMMDDTSMEGSESAFSNKMGDHTEVLDFSSSTIDLNNSKHPRNESLDLSAGALDLTKPEGGHQSKSMDPSLKFECEWCQARFSNIVAVYQHARGAHPLELKAQEMGETVTKNMNSQTASLLKASLNSTPNMIKAQQQQQRLKAQHAAAQQAAQNAAQQQVFRSQLFNQTFPQNARFRAIEPKPVQPNIQNIPTPSALPNFTQLHNKPLPASHAVSDVQTSPGMKQQMPGTSNLMKTSPALSPLQQQHQQQQQLRQQQLLQQLKAKKSISPNRRGRSFQCTKCSFTAPNAVTYLRHIERHGSNCRHTCRFCDYSIDRLNLLYQHMKGTHGDLWQGTPEEKINLTSGSSKNPDEQKFKMAAYFANRPEIGMMYDSFDMMQEDMMEMRSNGGEDSLNSSGSGSDLRAQLTEMKESSALRGIQVCVINGRKNYKCPKCPYMSSNAINTTNHLRQHGSNRKYQCNYCDYSVDNLKLIYHHLESVHPKEMSYSEPGKLPFSVSYEMSMEENNNSILWGEDAYQQSSSSLILPTCTKCPYKCSTVENLEKHIAQHGSSGPIICNFCDFHVDSQTALLKHLPVHRDHYEPDPADLEEEQRAEEKTQPSSYMGNMKQLEVMELVQMEKSRIEGGEEGVRKLDPQNLRNVLNRMKKNGERLRYRCSKCPYFSFCKNNIVKHRKQHLMRSQYLCTMCDYSATRAFLLNQHMKFHTDELEGSKLSGTFQDIILNPYDDKSTELLRSTDTLTDKGVYVQQAAEEEKDFSDEPVEETTTPFTSHEINMDEDFDEDEMASLERAEYEKYQQSAGEKSGEKTEFDALSTASDDSLAEMDPTALQQQISVNMSATLTAEEKIRYSCSMCPYRCNALRSFKCHIHMHGLNKKYICDHCNWSADRLNLLYQHRKVHASVPGYVLTPEDIVFLNREYALDNDLNSHMAEINTLNPKKSMAVMDLDVGSDKSLLSKNMADKKVYICKLCPYTCNNKNSYSYHKNLHGIKAKYTCTHCSYSVDKMSLLSQHIRLHQQDGHHSSLDQLKCTSCAFTSELQEVMDTHEIGHGSGKEFQCKLCDFAADKQTTLYQHQRVHMIEEGYGCESPKARDSAHSRQQFDLSNNLIAPQLYFSSQGHDPADSDLSEEDTPPKDLKCDRCPYGTPSKQELQDHAHRHTEHTSHCCPYCDFSAAHESTLIEHIQLHLPSTKVTSETLKVILEKKSKLGEKGIEAPEVAIVKTVLKVPEPHDSSDSKSTESKPASSSETGEGNQGEATEDKPKANRVYVCPYCEREFDDKTCMLKHEKQHLVGTKY